MFEKTGDRQETGLTGRVSGLRGLLWMGVFALSSSIALCGCGDGGGPSESLTSSMAVTPGENYMIAGPEGGPFFPASKAYLITNQGSAPMHWSASSSHDSISFSDEEGILDSGDSKIITVLANPVSGLTAGRYVIDITICNETDDDEVDVDAILNISAAGSLTIEPSIGFSSSGFVGGPFTPLAAAYTLENSDTDALDWTITSDQTWLTTSIPSGQLQSGATEDVTLSIDGAQAALLGAGSHAAAVLFSDITNETAHEIIVLLEITAPATLEIDLAEGFSSSGPPSGPFTPSTKTYTLGNSGSEPLEWEVSRFTNWVTLSSSAGTLAPGQQAAIVVGFDPGVTSGLPAGANHDELSIVNTTNGLGNSTRSVDLTVNVAPGTLAVSPPQTFNSSGQVGGPFTPASSNYTLTNNGDMTLTWQAAASAPWLALSLTGGNLAPGASTQVAASIQQATAASMTAGQFSGQITFTNLTNGSGNTAIGATLNISSPGGGAPILPPGTGFTGPTSEPGQIGAGTAKAIARWDVVPRQTIVEATNPTFTIGVVAFHIADIDYVSFILEGGTPISVSSMTLNPRTGVWEYCATIDASNFASDRPIEVRAIAVPKATAPTAQGNDGYPGGGYPRLLDSMFLYVDVDQPASPVSMHCSPGGNDSSGNGSLATPYRTPWRAAQAINDAAGSADGGIVYMDAGSYAWEQSGGGNVPSTTSQWLTFMPRPGVTRDQVRLTSGGFPGIRINHIRLNELTLNHYVHGDDSNGSAPGGDDVIWMDHVSCAGAGISTQTHYAGWNVGFQDSYWTDCDVRDDASSVPGGVTLARNVHCLRNQQGPGKPKLVVNCTWDTMNSGSSNGHPDFIPWNYTGPHENGIVYGVSARNAGGAQGLFVKDIPELKNIALVNILFETGQSGITCPNLDHMLIWNCTFAGGVFKWDSPQTDHHNMSVRGNVFNSMSPIGNGSVSDLWFDNNHFIGVNIIPGTNVTTGDPGWVTDFVPASNSPLRDRLSPLTVPIDLAGAIRPSNGTVGVYE